MRIASFNINNINKRLENLLAWLAKTKPDVACLQELKAEGKLEFIAVMEQPDARNGKGQGFQAIQ